MLLIGLMSGTSLDGIDAALVEVQGSAEADVRWAVRAFVSRAYSREQRSAIQQAIGGGGPATICRLHARLGEWFAEAALAVCAAAGVESAEVRAVGSHGQTVWHEPPGPDGRGATLQLGCAATIAERTGISVVSDFRARDMAAGGQGAPLVPWVDRLLFSLPARCRVLQNIGGMANLTWLPPRGAAAPLLAFDTGPGNALIDAAVELATQGKESYDRDGGWARAGRVDAALLGRLLGHRFFAQQPPRSTGREVFGRPFVEELVAERRPASRQDWADLVATLTALTAHSIAGAIGRWVRPLGVDEVVLTGGGARNPALRELLVELLAPTPVRAGEALAVDPDAKEAVAFAVLAWAFLQGLPANVPEATGASGPRLLGSYTPAAAETLEPTFRRSARVIRPADE
ncbi:MAG: anhydro-N-acetylmuramic acid kinase [Gemmatimonadetes bacterium]|nr:anhydro-N-acetylmuramic acid kinase [Gemmatimonadota bacterium]